MEKPDKGDCRDNRYYYVEVHVGCIACHGNEKQGQYADVEGKVDILFPPKGDETNGKEDD